jgi:hypothetical protein
MLFLIFSKNELRIAQATLVVFAHPIAFLAEEGKRGAI